MNVDLLITGGILVSSGETVEADVAVLGGVIVPTGEGSVEARSVLDARGCCVLPGAFDPHVHAATTVNGVASADDCATVSRGALAGGVTAVADFSEQRPGEACDAAAQRRLELWRDVPVRAMVHANLTDWSSGWEHGVRRLVKSGFRSVKVFLAYTPISPTDKQLAELARIAVSEGLVVLVHAEDAEMVASGIKNARRHSRTHPSFHPGSRPPHAEARAIDRAVKLVCGNGAALHVVHVSSSAGAETVRRAKNNHADITAETCPHYLFLTSEAYERENAIDYLVSPPLRSDEDRDALWTALADGTLDMIATDHCPFTTSARRSRGDAFWDAPHGLPGVETMVPLVLGSGVAGGRISFDRAVDVLCRAASRRFAMSEPDPFSGDRADLLLFDPARRWTIRATDMHGNSDHNPFEGKPIVGAIRATVLNGEIVFLNDESPQGDNDGS